MEGLVTESPIALVETRVCEETCRVLEDLLARAARRTEADRGGVGTVIAGDPDRVRMLGALSILHARLMEGIEL
jgi:hypothetical protein